MSLANMPQGSCPRILPPVLSVASFVRLWNVTQGASPRVVFLRIIFLHTVPVSLPAVTVTVLFGLCVGEQHMLQPCCLSNLSPTILLLTPSQYDPDSLSIPSNNCDFLR